MITKSLPIASLIAGMTLTLAVSIPAEEISFMQAPAAVRSGFLQHQPSAHPQTVTVEASDGATTYTIADPQADDKHTDTLSEDGRILACTHSIPMSELPQQVNTAAHRAYPNTTFHDAKMTMRPNDPDGTSFHLLYRANGMDACATFSANGRELPDPHMAAMSHPTTSPTSQPTHIH